MLASSTGIVPLRTSESGNVGWQLWTERLLLFLSVLLFVVKGVVPAWNRPDSDFPNYYLVASLYRQGYPVERVYDWVWLQRQKDHADIDKALVGFTPSTPPSALLALPLASLSLSQARHCWILINLGFLLSAAAILKWVTQLGWRRIGVLTFLAVAPLRENFLLGQIDAIILFSLTLSVALLLTGRPLLSGVALASVTAINFYPALFLILFALKKQWRAACGLIVGAAGASALSIYLFGAETCRFYMRQVFPWVLRGEIINPYNVGDSLKILLRRLFVAEPELNPTPVAHLPFLYAFLYSTICSFFFVAFLWAIGSKPASRSRQKLEWACFLFLLLLLSPELFPSQYIVLVLSAILVVDCLLASRQMAGAVIVVALYALACLPYGRLYGMNPRGWSNLLFFPRVIFMTALGGVLLWPLSSSSAEQVENPQRTRALAAAGVALIAISAALFELTFHHLTGQFDNYTTRVTVVGGSAIATDPAANSNSLFFGALVPRFSSSHDAYTVHKLQAGSITSYGGGGDWFHPAVIEDGHTAWAEVASKNGSQIVHFDSSAPGERQEFAIEAADAEQPAVSRRGDLLAFIREVRGRGSLWIRRIDARTIGTPFNQERELAGRQYDVREAAFYPNDQIIFSSWHNQGFRLHTADPQTGKIVDLSSVTCSGRYPAVSSDGEWIAFSCEFGGVWQLMAMNLRTGKQRQLTWGDCNSTAPTWLPDSKTLTYAADCGRALGVTALSSLTVSH